MDLRFDNRTRQSRLRTDEEWDSLAKLVLDDPFPMWQDSPFDGWERFVNHSSDIKPNPEAEANRYSAALTAAWPG